MILSSLKITVSPEKHRDVLQLVRSILGPTRARSGCIGISFFQDTDEPDTFLLLEKWESHQDLEKHLASDDYRKKLTLIDLSDQAPQIHFHEVSETKGMDWIIAVREAKHSESSSNRPEGIGRTL
jgi:quinol monooxygenase YgiN